MPAFSTLHPAERETYHGFVLTAQDALILIVKTHVGYLPRVNTRLFFHDRQNLIRSGATFVSLVTDIDRWTDSRLWTASHSQGHKFLMYRERAAPDSERKRRRQPSGQQAKAILDVFGSWPDDPTLLELRKKTFSFKIDGCTYRVVNYYDPADVISGALQRPTQDPTVNDVLGIHPIFAAYDAECADNRHRRRTGVRVKTPRQQSPKTAESSRAAVPRPGAALALLEPVAPRLPLYAPAPRAPTVAPPLPYAPFAMPVVEPTPYGFFDPAGVPQLFANAGVMPAPALALGPLAPFANPTLQFSYDASFVYAPSEQSTSWANLYRPPY